MEKQYTLQTQVTVKEEVLADFLSLASSDNCGCAWWKAQDQERFDAAKAELQAEGCSLITTEHIWARLLLKGGKLSLLDPESDWVWKGEGKEYGKDDLVFKAQIAVEGLEPAGGKWHDVDIVGLLNAMIDHTGHADFKKLLDEGDFWDADAVIQIAMYGEVIYG